jgi:hypothetical protein
MHRLAVFALAAFGCATVVTEPHPPGPPPDWNLPYAGRIVLSTSALSERIDEFETAWWHRLSVLGFTTRIAYDDTRAVFDIYGASSQEFSRLAAALTDPGGWSLNGSRLFHGFVSEWLPATQGCDCAAQLKVLLDSSVACGLSTGGATLTRAAGSPVYEVTLKVTWTISYRDSAIVTPDVESERRADGLKCPDQQWPNVTVKLPPGVDRAQAFAIALAIGGNDLPEIPRMDSVATAAQGARP